MSTDPIVLLHGLGVDHRMWSLQLPRLSSVGEVYAPDLPGFGCEPPLSAGDRSPGAYADWVAFRVRSRWPGRRVCVAGYSMGGTLALLLALRHAGLVSRLVVACSPPRWVYGWRRFLRVFLSRFTARPAVEVFQLAVRVGAWRFQCDPFLRKVVGDMVRLADRPTMVSLCRELSRTDLSRDLNSVSVPSLVVAGTRDLWQTVSVAEAFARGLKKGRLRVFLKAGHMLCLSRPSEFGETLAEFFSMNEVN